jgi:hypothetical protein
MLAVKWLNIKRLFTALAVFTQMPDAVHDLSSCPDQDIVLGARIASADVISGSGQRKCPLSFGDVHRRRTGPCRRQLQAGRDEEESPPEDAE